MCDQCSESPQAKLRGQKNRILIYESSNVLKLMKNIKKWILNQEGSSSSVAAADHALVSMYRAHQNWLESLTGYRRRSSAATEVLDHIDIELGKALVCLQDKSLEDEGKQTVRAANAKEIKEEESRMMKKFAVYRSIAAIDMTRFSNVVVSQKKKYVAGSDKFSINISVASNLLKNRK